MAHEVLAWSLGARLLQGPQRALACDPQGHFSDRQPSVVAAIRHTVSDPLRHF